MSNHKKVLYTLKWLDGPIALTLHHQSRNLQDLLIFLKGYAPHLTWNKEDEKKLSKGEIKSLSLGFSGIIRAHIFRTKEVIDE